MTAQRTSADASRPSSDGDLVADLCRPEAYPSPPGAVKVIQTHMSWLFMTRDRVYKVKKPVHFAFADTRALETRRALCHDEVRLNSRLAGDTYLSVTSITRDHVGRMCFGGEGEVVEYAVCMKRLPAGSMMDARLKQGFIDNEALRDIAARLAHFHADAATGEGVDKWARPDAVRRLVLDNLNELAAFVAPIESEGHALLTPRMLASLERQARQFLDRNAPLFERRVREGRIRDGHGDLHAGNICKTDNALVFYDCLEFSDSLRCGDVANDLAFLAMDLDERGYRAFSRFLVHSYAALAADEDIHELIDFYKTHRALVRAKVHGLAASDVSLSDDDAADHRARAQDYVHLALSYGLPATLIAMCGLPASGKSWLGRRLSRRLGALGVHSDLIRKQLAGLPPTEHESDKTSTLYGADMTDATYRELRRRAASALSDGRVVVADATFSARDKRQRLLDVALRLGAPTVFVQVLCDSATVRERMAQRAHDRREVSDADWNVYKRAIETFEQLDDVPTSHRLMVVSDTDMSVQSVTASILESVLTQAEVGPRVASVENA